MHDFLPTPMYSSAWWSEVETYLDSPFASHDIAVNQHDLFPGPDSWVADCLLTSSLFGEGRLMFPTATDLLLWLRWSVLPASQIRNVGGEGVIGRGRDVELHSEAQRIAEIIDAAPAGSSSEELLLGLKPQLARLWGDFEVLSYCSVHQFVLEWFADEGYPTIEEAVRGELGSDEITYHNGRWEMPAQAWKELRDIFSA